MRLLIAFLLLCSSALYSLSEAQDRHTLTLVSYNVENFFDTIPSKQWDDSEYLPSGPKAWSGERMIRKAHQIAEVVSHVSEWEWPAIIALQEVESDACLDLLAHRTKLSPVGYRYLCGTGSDERGSHVALLYDPDRFALQHTEEWPLFVSADSVYPTRNLLYARGIMPSGAALSVIVCHLPSRRGGESSARAREQVVAMLRHRTDSLLAVAPTEAIIVLGDFNATPSESLTNDWASPLEVYETTPLRSRMVDLTPPRAHTESQDLPPGSYYYRKQWQAIDRLMVSANLLSDEDLPRVQPDSVHVSLPPKSYLLDKPTPWGRPRRTYGGDHYLGGPSDHLPLVAQIIY